MKIKSMILTFLMLILTGCGGTTNNSGNVTDKGSEIAEKNTEINILAMGQSNMANRGIGFNYTSKYDVLRIDSTYEYVLASSPVISNPMASETNSNFIPYLGDLLIEYGKYSTMTYANVAVNGTCIINWIPSSPNFQKIRNLVNQGFTFTDIIFHQGECDSTFYNNTSKDNYKMAFLEMKKGIRDLGIDAPIYLARASYVNGIIGSNLIAAQNELISENEDILEGPDTDVLGSEYRYDNVHFNEIGLIEHAKLWNQKIQ